MTNTPSSAPNGSRTVLGDAYLRNARYFTDKTALVSDARSLTHGELADRVIRLINALARLGIARQSRLALLSHNRCAMVEVGAAAELGGFIVLPLNHRLAAEELIAICSDARPAVLFHEREFQQTAMRVAVAAGAVPVCLDAPHAESDRLSYEELIEAERSGSLASQAAPEDGVHMIYTSGTTGRPKGVLLGQRGQVEMTRTLAAAAGYRAESRLLLVMPLFHVGGKSQQLCATWQAAQTVVRPRFVAADWMRLIQAHRISIGHLAPVMLQNVLDEPLDGVDLSSLNTIIYSSSPIPRNVLVRAIERFGPIFVQYYGMTETGPLNTMLDKEFHRIDGPEGRLAAAGYPHIGSRVEIRSDEGLALPQGEAGEVYIDTPTLMLGYWNAERAAPDPVPRGWFPTGDVGYIGKDALLYLVDRKKDMIVSGGENIYSREVEDVLCVHAAVREVAVVGVPDARWGEAVAAYVVFNPGQTVSAEELIAHCRRHLASYKKPREVHVVDTLPRLPATGKIDKKALRAGHWAGHARFVS